MKKIKISDRYSDSEIPRYLWEEIVALEKERDKLYNVVEELIESAEYWSEYYVPIGIVGRMKDAIGRDDVLHSS